MQPNGLKRTSISGVSKNPGAAVLSQAQQGTKYGSYLYWNADSDAGVWTNEDKTVHLGVNAGRYSQGLQTVALGANAGSDHQGNYAVSIGQYAGSNNQGANAVSIGQSAGQLVQGVNAVSIGQFAGFNSQGANAVSVGPNAGQVNQGINAVAIGPNAGNTLQLDGAVAIGKNAGLDYQNNGSIAIGLNSGMYNQGINAIAIGTNSGATNQSDNSIILNASGSALDATTPGLFVNPIRGPYSSSNVLSYNTITNEVYYNGSSERYKYDIADLSANTAAIYDLQPRQFKYKLTGEQDVGLIAEEAYLCDPSFAYLDKDNIPEGIQWNAITTYLIAEFKKLKEELKELEHRTSNIEQIENRK